MCHPSMTASRGWRTSGRYSDRSSAVTKPPLASMSEAIRRAISLRRSARGPCSAIAAQGFRSISDPHEPSLWMSELPL